MSYLTTDIKFVKGIGEKRAQLFKKRLGLFSLHDLITYFPRAYEDWSVITELCDITINEQVCIKAKITGPPEVKYYPQKKLTKYTFYAYDRTGQIRVILFNNKYLAESLTTDSEYLFYGKIKRVPTYREMTSPEIRPVNESKVRPIYSATNGLSTKQIEKIIVNLLPELQLDEFLPEEIVKRYGLLSHKDAILAAHTPKSLNDAKAARRRLAFEELLFLRLGFMGYKNRTKAKSAHIITPPTREAITSLFSFELTDAQKRVINECLRDMRSSHPMNRLIQGDVGSGKTAVAAVLCFSTFKSGYNSVMLAPTEILANQHYKYFKKLFEGLDIRVELLTGSLTSKKKKAVKDALKDNKINILVATHAVLSDDVELNNTALIITDEQHRFGVSQRSILSQKAGHPHTLVMSATPIPRTMGLVVYGDLDISIIDELPKGRTPIKTYSVEYPLRERAIGFIKKHIDEGYQGYVVCPMIDATPENELVAATQYSEQLAEGPLKGYNVGLLHGKMKPKEKEKVMNDFASGSIRVLVSTTVVEVGVDVPNAVIMVVENADRFGLSQLHQLRGRVGRGTAQSTCIFISNSTSRLTEQRLNALCSTTDGFKIAEADLQLRGPGNFLGKEQHGLPRFKIADLLEDQDILYSASSAAEEILAADSTLSLPQNQELKERVNDLFSEKRCIEFN